MGFLKEAVDLLVFNQNVRTAKEKFADSIIKLTNMPDASLNSQRTNIMT
jgi:hypothetical protein